MYSSQEWWNAAESATPGDPGDPIAQSLRFRGAQCLQRTFTASNPSICTFSAWVKRSEVGNADNIFGAASSASEFERLIFNPTPNLSVYSQTGGADYINVRTVALYRDPSAWYHIVYVKDTTQTTPSERVRIYINGERVSNLESTVFPGQDTTNGSINNNILHTLGRDPDTGVDYLDGYLADVHFIDGQALDCTAFGRFNEFNVWVPKDIDFGNSLPKYSEMLYPASGGSLNFPDNAFDGEIINACYITPVDTGVTFRPTNEMEITSLEVYVSNNNMTATFGGVTTPTPTLTWTEIATSGTLGPNNPIVFDVSGGLNCNINGIKVNGEYLLNPYLWTSQLFTSPGYGSIDYTSTDQNFQGIAPLENGFDGQLNTFVQCASGNSWFFKPQGLTATKIEIQLTNAYGDPTGGAFEFNGVEQTGFPGQSWYTVYEGEPITDWTIGGWYRPDGGNGFAAIRVNGNILRNGQNPTYGVNGFHLDFSDPNDIGKDVSGNGNHFGQTGFNTQPPGLWTNQVYSTPETDIDWDTTSQAGYAVPDSGGYGRAQMFDGNVGASVTNGQVVDTSWVALFRPNNPIQVTSLRIYGCSSNASSLFPVYINGSDTPITSVTGGNNPAATTISFTGTLTAIAIGPSQNGEAAGWAGIEINGQVLIDSTGEDYDLVDDSPTQNYATLNPLPPRSSGTISDANLKADISAIDQYVWGTQAMTSKCYWETQFISGDPFEVGLVDIRHSTRNSYLGGTGGDTYGYGTNGQITNSAASGVYTYPTYGLGDVIGQAYDPESGKWWAFKNGVSITDGGNPELGIAPIVLPNGYIEIPEDKRAFMSPGFGPNGGTSVINYGQKAFFYEPPSGYKSLQSQNAVEATVLDGREHFQIITGAIDAIFYNEGGITGSVQQPVVLTDPIPYLTSASGNSFLIDLQQSVTSVDVVWESGWSSVVTIWCSNDGNTWTDTGQAGATLGVKYTYSISGAPFRYVRAYYGTGYACGLRSVNSALPILDQAKDAFSEGLYWIKDRVNANDHQLLDSVRGGDQALTLPTVAAQVPYVTPSGQSVAWCWSAPETWSNLAGSYGATLASSGQRNREAGFSIITYTGIASHPQTIAHGLDKAPEFMIFRDYDSGQNTVVGGPGILPVTESILMNFDGASFTSSGTFNNTEPTDELITLGQSNTVLTDAGGGYVCYAWHSVPGYSAFGTYAGTSDSNKGPFIYTGFKPAFVLIKKLNGSNNWFIYDNQLNQHNPCENCLFPNTNEAEINSPTNAGYLMDMLSNGFKFYTYGSGLNELGYDYMYAAFAENPLQLPVTAR